MKQLTLFLSIVLLIQCGQHEMKSIAIDLTDLQHLPQQYRDQFASQKIYFGHQSVGFNIMNGLEAIVHELPDLKLEFKEITNTTQLGQPAFAHSRIGVNKDPLSKIADFKQKMENGIADSVDIAFFKFCYIDIREDTDVENVFNVYKTTMDSLIQKYPATQFIHVTVPLRIVQTGPIVNIKKIIGRKIGGYDDNIKRAQFNELLKSNYIATGSVFDLATIESTYPGGRRATFQWNDQKYPYLIPAYTNDGGHLNEIGQKWVARQLLLFLTTQNKDQKI